MLQSFQVRTSRRTEMVDITPSVRECLAKANMKSGLCVVYVAHTTAGVTINENADPDVRHDMESFLSKLVPEHSGFAHAEGNSDAHIKSSMMGFSQTLIVEKGQPVLLGTWQDVCFCEFDGPRTRKVFVKLLHDH